MKIAVGVEYDGTGFSGWQQQPGARTVQAVVESALGQVADHPVKVVCAGRTDAGVHAAGQVVHFEARVQRSMRSWVLGANVHLPADVSLCWARPVPQHFHARFSARSRWYRYIWLNRWVRPALLRSRVAWYHRPLDAGRMQVGGDQLLGEHDFSSFRAVACQASTAQREIQHLSVSRSGDLVYLDVVANAFLHHMVRNIAGALMSVGAGERPPEWVGELLQARDRTAGGVTAPAAGLYLVDARYSSEFELPAGSPPWFG